MALLCRITVTHAKTFKMKLHNKIFVYWSINKFQFVSPHPTAASIGIQGSCCLQDASWQNNGHAE